MSSLIRTPMRRRALLAAAVAAAAGVSLAGRAAAQASSLRVAWWGGVDRAKKFDAIFAAWNAENPDVEIIPEPAEWGAYWDRFATQSIARTLPDVFGMTERQVTVYSDLMLDLQPFIDDGRLDLSAYDDLFIQAGIVGGQFKMLNTGMTIPSLVFNRTMLEAAGLTMPDKITYPQYRDLALAIGKSGGTAEWGANDDGGQTLGFDTFLRQKGRQLFTMEGLGFEEADWAEWLSIWEEMRQVGAVPPAAITAEMTGVPQSDTLIAKSRVGMMLTNHNQLLTFQRYTDGELGIAIQPIRDGGEPIALLAGTYWGIHAGSENIDQAVAFLNFFINNDAAILAYAAELGALPSSYGIEVLTPALDEPNRRLADYTNSVMQYGSVSGPRIEAALQAESLILRANQDVANGRGTPESVAASYFAEAQSIVSR
jgi:multiple sugar transport system substrate-binding protein